MAANSSLISPKEANLPVTQLFTKKEIIGKGAYGAGKLLSKEQARLVTPGSSRLVAHSLQSVSLLSFCKSTVSRWSKRSATFLDAAYTTPRARLWLSRSLNSIHLNQLKKISSKSNEKSLCSLRLGMQSATTAPLTTGAGSCLLSCGLPWTWPLVAPFALLSVNVEDVLMSILLTKVLSDEKHDLRRTLRGCDHA